MVYGMVYGMDYGMAWFACGGAHLDAAPCHGARNIQRLCPLTTFLASTDGGIACDRSHRDAAPYHVAQNIQCMRPLTTFLASTDSSIMMIQQQQHLNNNIWMLLRVGLEV